MSDDIGKRITNIHHVGFVVHDLDQSVEFYEMLGFKLTDRWIEHEHECADGLGVPGAQIELAAFSGYEINFELIQFLKSAGDNTPIPSNKIGAGHLSILTDDIYGLIERLKNTGVKVASEITDHPTASWVHLFDPDGIRVELMQMM